MLRRIFGLIVIAVLLGSIGVLPALAQDNLLVDGGFEARGNFKRVADGDGASFDVPQAWEGWVTTSPRTQPWMNFIPTGFPHTGIFKTPAESTQSLHIARGGATFTAAVYQTVTVPENANVIGSAWGYMERRAGNADSVPGAQFRIGIDPTGGNNPLSPSIIWSPTVNRADEWVQATVEATAQGTRVTLFLYATQTQPSDPNGIYWDSARLSVGGGGGTAPGNTPVPGATAVPVVPTPAFANFVSPQPAAPDGSITHTVQPGDTLDAIAVAYGVTRDQILQLNNLASPRFLQVGQQLVIRRATAPAATATPATSDPTAVAGAPTQDSAPSAAATEETEPAEPEPTNTPEPTSTPTEAPPAPVTQVAAVRTNVTALCVWMFEDSNQNRIQESNESLLAGGNIVVNRGAEVVQTYQTDGESEPYCFEDIATGNYTVVASPPAGYGLTTSAQLAVRVQSGATVDVRFGAAQGVQAVAPPPVDLREPATDQPVVDAAADDPVTELLQISGLIVFGLAGLVLLGGVSLALILRSR